ncbi:MULTISPECIES: YhdX family protein [Metabacillus]|uniref:YhdX family protein n=1 Tax=Metabacillus rhizolycopersici TaxID=2875709 RepID=A0ABS7UM51_9BACI|nr:MULTISPECIES: YhdX family protein [Metabacillus]MBZ5748944.1 YhdX family protein [Metabacillus rhizolycopersici]MCM3650967.1 YhdX family protein [Metabacillus litoralis]
MGKGRIRVEERIKVETDEEIFEAKLLDEKNIRKDQRKVKEKNK